jgi:hypothetical protein
MKKILYFYTLIILSLSLTAVEFEITNKSNDTLSVFFNFADEDGNPLWSTELPYEIANQNYTLKPQERKTIKPRTALGGKNYIVSGISAATSKLAKGSYPITEDKRNKNLAVFISIKTLQSPMGGEIKEMPYFEVKMLKF